MQSNKFSSLSSWIIVFLNESIERMIQWLWMIQWRFWTVGWIKRLAEEVTYRHLLAEKVLFCIIVVTMAFTEFAHVLTKAYTFSSRSWIHFWPIQQNIST